MVSDRGVAVLSRVYKGVLSASAYLRAVSLWIPSSLAIAGSDRPRVLASRTASHRAFCRRVGFLCPGTARLPLLRGLVLARWHIS